MPTKPPAPTAPKLPSPEDFYKQKGLYDKQAYVGEEIWQAVDVLYFQGTYDNYCVRCHKSSTFQLVKRELPLELNRQRQENLASTRVALMGQSGLNTAVLPEISAGFYEVAATCTRHSSHVQKFFFMLRANNECLEADDGKVSVKLEKIGQYPALADLAIPLTKRFRSVLTKEQLQELNKAIGLHSHGVGAGAYVYLRRIFEALIEEARKKCAKDSSWVQEDYVRMHMNEKIKAVESYLPDFLVQNPTMYAVLSKGIHSLSEEECSKYFNTMKTGIEMILDEKLDQKNKADRIEKANRAIQEAHQNLA